MDHLHYYKKENDAFCLLVSPALKNCIDMYNFWVVRGLAPDAEVYFPIGSIALRLILTIGFLWLASHEDPSFCCFRTKAGWSLIFIVCVIIYIMLVVLSINTLHLNSAEDIPNYIMQYCECINLGVVLMYMAFLFWDMGRQKD